MNKNFLFPFSLLILLLTLSVSISYSECKGIAKKCIPRLSPYIYTGQLNSTTLFEGEAAELVMTFTGGQQYRILSCGAPNLEPIKMIIYDSKRKVIFNNTEHNLTQFLDLKIGATDDYTIQISISEAKTKPGGTVQNGCVAVLVGFKNE